MTTHQGLRVIDENGVVISDERSIALFDPRTKTVTYADLVGVGDAMEDPASLASRLAQMSSYTGVQPVPIVEHANEVLEIIGAIIIDAAPYEDRKTKEPKPGFRYALWKSSLVDANGDNVVLKISSKQGIALTETVLVPVAGYMDWFHPVTQEPIGLKIKMRVLNGTHVFRIFEK